MKYRITVKPNARQAKVEKVSDNELIVSVNAPPHEGKANVSLIKILSGYFDAPKSKIKIITGKTSKKKLIEIP